MIPIRYVNYTTATQLLFPILPISVHEQINHTLEFKHACLYLLGFIEAGVDLHGFLGYVFDALDVGAQGLLAF